ncbi:unnamed protein product [Owenia fusiformis]|uniref:Neurotransmitter-gated ion-channel ligand-binding domain-containing protein n=1 Tax=Owenia fusiformis TaxID=6347 RepID=A0A8S4Q7C0_OWEFU|nr:unnamed protein product [Owenia fusiformis]
MEIPQVAVYRTFCCIWILYVTCVKSESLDETLTKRFLDGYRHTSVRPSESVNVSFGMAVNSIDELNERNEVIEINAYLRMKWTDNYFSWNTSYYVNVIDIAVTPESIWTPDIQLYETVGVDAYYTHKTLVKVDSKGSVLWVPHMTLKTKCAMNFRRFPYDTQTCQLKFGSWIYTMKQLDLQPSDELKDLNSFKQPRGWVLTKFNHKRIIQKYGCCEDAYVDIVYELQVSRRSSFFTCALVVPIVFAAMILPFLFLIPPHFVSRLIVAIGLITFEGIGIIAVQNKLSFEHNEIPLIVTFMSITIVLSVFNIVLSIFALSVWTYGLFGKQPPNTGRLSWCIPSIVPYASYTFEEDHTVSMQNLPNAIHTEGSQSESPGTTGTAAQKDASAMDSMISGWRRVVLVVDRIMFLLYSIIFVVLSVALCADV